MRTILKITLLLTVIILIGFNISIVKISGSNEISLLNIKALQASAGEATCDATTTCDCKIGEAVGTGRLIVTK